MKILSNFFLALYFLVSCATFILLVLDMYRDLHFMSDDTFFFVLIPATIIFGVVGGFHSPRMLFIKLIPWAFALLLALLLGDLIFTIIGLAFVLTLMAIQSSLGGLLTHWYIKKYSAQPV